MNKKSNIIKIVKEDILRILGEQRRRVSLEILKEKIKVSLSFICEAIEELEREGLIKSQQIFYLDRRGGRKDQRYFKKNILSLKIILRKPEPKTKHIR